MIYLLFDNSTDPLWQAQENLQQLLIIRCAQASNRIPARLRLKAIGATSWVAANRDVVESLWVRVKRWVQEADWAFLGCDASFVEEGYDSAPGLVSMKLIKTC